MKIKKLSLIFLFCGIPTLGFAQSSPIYVNGSNVGIGMTNPTQTLSVNKSIGLVGSPTQVTDAATLSYYSKNGYMYMRGGVAGLALGDDGFDSAIYIPNDNYISFETNGLEKVRIQNDGNVGIGTKTPAQKLEVAGTVSANRFVGDGSGLRNLSSVSSQWGSGDNGVISYSGGFVGIGTTTPTQRLEVVGSIKATDMIVSQASWADFVFEPGYRLRPLADLESFVLNQKHLPDVPSEKEVVSKGMSVASMQKLHMQKIEELTLYVIALEKENKKLKEAQDDLVKRVVRLEGQKGL